MFLAVNPYQGEVGRRKLLARHRHRHPELNTYSQCEGGQVTDVEIGAFLSSPRSPEKIALLRLIGTLMLDPQGTDADAEPSAVNTAREWSDAELTELGNMLVRGLSMGEIARLVRRDHGDVQDKVVEVGRAFR
jgi:hypothetical protein